jgi:serine/threonine protein kinase
MSEYFQTISTPIDLSSIGLNMILETQDDLKKENDLYRSYVKKFLTKITTVDKSLNTLESVKGPDVDTFVSGSIEIVGNVYEFHSHAGNGSYGATAIVQNEGNLFALKEQISDDDKDDFTVVKEAIINYILYESTAPGRRPFTPKIHRIFYSTRTTTEGDKKSIYILSEALSFTGYYFLSGINNITDGSVILYSQLVERLRELYDKYEFNHGDLKPGNVMFDSQKNLRLIDFGFSRLVLNKDDMSTKIIIDTTEYTSYSSKFRDLTLMAVLIRYNFKPMIPDFVDDIETGYSCENRETLDKTSLSQAMNNIPTRCYGNNISNWENVYKFINTYVNTKGTFESVLATITPLIEDLRSKPDDEYEFATIYKENPDPSQPLPEQPSQPPNTLAEALEGGGGANRGPKPVKRGGAKVKRKTKSKRIYRNYGKSRRRT